MRLALLLPLLIAFAPVMAPAADAPLPTTSVVMRVRAQVAELLGKRPTDVDVGRSLAAQGADELDLVELVMAVEEEFGVSITDDEIGRHGAWNTLSVQRLAEIIQKLRRTQQPKL